MLTIDKLNAYGANTEEGLARCMGNEALFLRLTASVTNQPEFDRLGERIESRDLKGAFEAAHALKGVLGNLSLTPLYDIVCEITELLRGQTEIDYQPYLDRIAALRADLKALAD
jgi:HPt (histidine-containing phosphotransfer) domain-containing protein